MLSISHFVKATFFRCDKGITLNALTAVGALMTLIDFTLSNARRFYSSMGNPLAVKRLKQQLRNLMVAIFLTVIKSFDTKSLYLF